MREAFGHQRKLARKLTLPTGRDGARPLRGSGAGRCVQDGGVRSPRPTGATQVVPSSGPMWASAPTDRRGSLSDHPGQRRTAERLRRGCEEMGGNRDRGHPKRGQQRRTIPQSRLRRASSLYTREPCPAGDGGSGRRGRRPLWKAQASRRAAKRPRPRGRGMGGNRRKNHPKRRTAPATTQAALSEAESAERGAGQIRSLPGDLRVQHGVQGSEVSARPRPCSR